MVLDLPRPGTRRVSVRLTKDAQRQIRGGHPWVFERAITKVGHIGNSGDLAVVFDDQRRFLAIGLYDPDSPIRVRVLHQGEPRQIDDSFWRDRLVNSLDRRRELARSAGTTAYRCVHGENDGLPGLVVDRYDRTWVVKLDTAAWLAHLTPLVTALSEVAEPEPGRVVLRMSRKARAAAGAMAPAEGTVVAGPPLEGPVRFLENGLAFEADVAQGQKTDHFLDQRQNRFKVGALAAGARVLDVFSCTGGFTVHAAAGGADTVHSIDASPHAIAMVRRHLELNLHRPEVASCRATSGTGDAFDLLAEPEPGRVVLRMSRKARAAAGAMAPAEGTVVAGPPLEGPVRFLENGLAFEADVAQGQKTDHFLDQRQNRFKVGALAAGARVLDVFSCTGGFTVHAAAGGADTVHSIDASPHAIAMVRRHLELNLQRPEVARCRATSGTGDAFDLLAELAERGRRFDLVVVDPPSFASKQADVDRALGAYGRLTRLALDVLAPGGALVQSSCSSRVSADAFYQTILSAAEAARRPLRQVERTGHASDHPIGFAQGAYLKTVFARAG